LSAESAIRLKYRGIFPEHQAVKRKKTAKMRKFEKFRWKIGPDGLYFTVAEKNRRKEFCSL